MPVGDGSPVPAGEARKKVFPFGEGGTAQAVTDEGCTM